MTRSVDTLRLRDRVRGDFVIEVAFTGPGLDVSDHAAEDVRARALAAVAAATSAEPRLMRQVHGAEVVAVDATSPTPTCDAMLTVDAGIALLARAADCVPVLLADPATGVVAAAHAGRPGVERGVVPSAIAAMSAAGAAPTVAWIGPHVCGRCYEVPSDLQERVVRAVPETRSTTSWQTPALDLGAGVRAQLAQAGIEDVRDVGVCTREDVEWPSYRRDGDAATRFAGLVWSHR